MLLDSMVLAGSIRHELVWKGRPRRARGSLKVSEIVSFHRHLPRKKSGEKKASIFLSISIERAFQLLVCTSVFLLPPIYDDFVSFFHGYLETGLIFCNLKG